MTDWLPIETYEPSLCQVIVCNKEDKWIRFGRQHKSMGSKWYYSTTNEYSNMGSNHVDPPTHWTPMLKLPE